jgi:hypothetical protein
MLLTIEMLLREEARRMGVNCTIGDARRRFEGVGIGVGKGGNVVSSTMVAGTCFERGFGDVEMHVLAASLFDLIVSVY